MKHWSGECSLGGCGDLRLLCSSSLNFTGCRKTEAEVGPLGPGAGMEREYLLTGGGNELVLNKGDGAVTLLKAREAQPD